MFDSLSECLEGVFKILKGESKFMEINIVQFVKEICCVFVVADVNYKIVKDFMDIVKEKVFGQENVLSLVKFGELMVKIVNDEFVSLMGGEVVFFDLKGKLLVIFIVGLQGFGKIIFFGKLVCYLKVNNKKSFLFVVCDVYCLVVINQFGVIGDQIKVLVYKEMENKNLVEIVFKGIVYVQVYSYDVVIIDMAGCLLVDEEMMEEIFNIKEVVQFNEMLFVVDFMIGQDVVNIVKVFNDWIDYDGVVLIKFDGDMCGGVVFFIKYIVGKLIKFVFIGEKMDMFDVFYFDCMASCILGMGDIIFFVECVEQQFDEEQAKKLEKKIKKNKFDFNDFLEQIG